MVCKSLKKKFNDSPPPPHPKFAPNSQFSSSHADPTPRIPNVLLAVAVHGLLRLLPLLLLSALLPAQARLSRDAAALGEEAPQARAHVHGRLHPQDLQEDAQALHCVADHRAHHQARPLLLPRRLARLPRRKHVGALQERLAPRRLPRLLPLPQDRRAHQVHPHHQGDARTRARAHLHALQGRRDHGRGPGPLLLRHRLGRQGTSPPPLLFSFISSLTPHPSSQIQKHAPIFD